MQWPRSRTALVASSVLLPPLGLVLLWLRSGTRVAAKIFGSLVILILGIAELFLFYGLRLEMDGSGFRPFFNFYKPGSHYTALDRSRVVVKEITQARMPVPRPYWTDFRGPKRDGVYDETPILTEWPRKGLPRLWKQPSGAGYASFVVANGKAFTIEQRRQQEAVVAYDVETGREIWKHSWTALFHESMGGDGPRATPTWHENRLYALGATGEFHCLNAETGELIWAKNILADNQSENLTWGMAGSPLIVDDKVVVVSGNCVMAYDKLTGSRIWKSMDEKQAYASPMLAMLAGKRQILVVTAQRVAGLAVEDGAVLWGYPWTTEYDVNSAQPVIVSDNRFFISSGYGHGAGIVELTAKDRGLETRTVWQNNRMKNKFNTSVLYQGHLYGLDEGILACIDVETGALKWKGGRYGYGQVLLAGGHLVILTESGDVVLVKATPEGHQELARFSALSGKTWNVPALAGGRLLVRNEIEMACFRIGRSNTASSQ